jgi:hypothetical protein
MFGCSYGYWDPLITCYGNQNDDNNNNNKKKNGGDDDVDGGNDDDDDIDNVGTYIGNDVYACYDTKRGTVGLDTTTPWNKHNHFLGELSWMLT